MAVLTQCTGVLYSVTSEYGFLKSVVTRDGREYPDVFVRVSALKRRVPRHKHLMRTYAGTAFVFDVVWSSQYVGRLEAVNVTVKPDQHIPL